MTTRPTKPTKPTDRRRTAGHGMTRRELLKLCPSLSRADADRLLAERPDFGRGPRIRRLLTVPEARREGATHRMEDATGARLGAPADPRPGVLSQLREAEALAGAKGSPKTAAATVARARAYFGLGSEAMDRGNTLEAAGLFFGVGLALGRFTAELHSAATAARYKADRATYRKAQARMLREGRAMYRALCRRLAEGAHPRKGPGNATTLARVDVLKCNTPTPAAGVIYTGKRFATDSGDTKRHTSLEKALYTYLESTGKLDPRESADAP